MDELSAIDRSRLPVLRIGVVAYLNMLPLHFGLPQWAGGRLQLISGTPRQLAQWLIAGEIDMGMVPVAGLFEHPEWSVCPAGMIGSQGPVRSVLVMGPNPPGSWQRLRPDSHSVTSNALARLTLAHMGLKVELGEMIPNGDWSPPSTPPEGAAMVTIGSRALAWHGLWDGTEPGGCKLDLGACWTERTGLPFINALWAVRPGVKLGRWPEVLAAIKRLNMGRLSQIIATWPTLNEERLTPDQALDYLTENIHFDLTDRALEGLHLFYREGVEHGLFGPSWKLNLADGDAA